MNPPLPFALLRLITLTLALAFGAMPEVRADDATMATALKEAGFKPQIKEGKVVEFGWGNPAWTPDLWHRLPELTSLRSLIAEGKCTDDEGIEVLTRLPKLDKLFINGSTFDDAGFAILARVPSLTSIGFDHNHVFTGSGIASLKGAANLRALGLGGCMKFSSEGAKACGELVQLETLKLHHLGLGDDSVTALAPLVNLRTLELDNSFKGTLTGEGLAHLGTLKALEKLSLGEFVTTYDSGLRHLATLTHLKTLNLAKVGASADDIARLQAALPGTQITHTMPSDTELASWQQRVEKIQNSKH